MHFLSLEFSALLAAVLVVYWAFPKRTWQNLLLTAASLSLVLYFGPSALAVLVLSTLFEWMIAKRLGGTESPRGRLALLWISIAMNLAQLAFFKYSHFFLPPMSGLFSSLGLHTATLNLIMPVGLSFWTLQKMTLTLGVFHRRRPPEKSFWRCLLFTSFFPTLLSGPIERSWNLLPQFDKTRRWNSRLFSEGVWLFALGAFLKAVVADNVAVCADALLAPGSAGISVLLGIWAYALQIFGDFAGYSFMARGCARMLGIEVTENFVAPYLARNLSDYWKHWHVSLSTWLNEFIFAPVSMELRRWRNTGIVAAIWATFLGSGLWHGTGWMFLAWGGLHALGLTVFTLSKDWRKRMKSRFGGEGWLKWAAILITFHWVCLGYVFFRAPNAGAALEQLHALFRGSWNPLALSFDWGTLAFSAIAVFWVQGRALDSGKVFWIFEKPVAYRVAAYLALGFLLLRYYAPSDRFIYFQF